MIARRKKYTKIALALSIGLLMLWVLLGTGASLAWFTDTTPVQKNVLNIGELDLEAYYRAEDGKYYKFSADQVLFDEEALYEPGYVQVVYLKVKNEGEIPLDYRTGLIVNDYTPATNWYGLSFNLQDHLRFGIVSAKTEASLMSLVGTRPQAEGQAAIDLSSSAEIPLNQYHTQIDRLAVGEEHYIALIVRMPETVGNVANYRNSQPPKVDLGVIISASQPGTLE